MAIPPLPRSPRTGLPMIPKGEGRRTSRCSDAPPDGLRRGIIQFNEGAYWECHETLEALWRSEPDAVRYLYQGILLAAVGLLHLQRGNRHGALSKLRAGVTRLEPYAPECMGVDVATLRADLAPVIARLESLPAGATIMLGPDDAPHITVPPAPDAGETGPQDSVVD